MKHKHYIAKGRSLDIVRGLQKQLLDAHNAAVDFAKKHGVKQLYGGSGVSCADFEGDIPEGWKKGRDGHARPNMKTKIGKTIAAEMGAIPCRIGGWEVDNAFGVGPVMDTTTDGGLALHHAGFVVLAGEVVINIPYLAADAVTPPEDAEEITEAQYLRMKADDLEAKADDASRPTPAGTPT